MSSLLDMEPKTPSKTDKLLNQYIQNNQKQIDNTKGTGEATIIKIPVLATHPKTLQYIRIDAK